MFVSAKTGEGMEELRDYLVGLASRNAAPAVP
jgi:hypothetical protein